VNYTIDRVFSRLLKKKTALRDLVISGLGNLVIVLRTRSRACVERPGDQMDITGTYTFDAAADAVWTLLMDTSAIAGCVPGCRELRPDGNDRYRAELSVPVAAVTGQFDATIALEDKVQPRSYTLVVQATGRPGFVRGQAAVTLTPDNERTTVQVTAHADVGGAIARVGQRLLEGAARMMMDRFFECLRRKLGD